MWELIELANHHPRVNILQPGPGVGGHCIAVDPWFIVAADKENAKIIKAAREINDGKPEWVVNKVAQAIESANAGSVAVLGLAFKANIDDLRESPSLHIAEMVAQRFPSVNVLAVEPNIAELPATLAAYPNVSLTGTNEAIDQAPVVLLLVDHDEFKDVRAAQLQGKKIEDTKGLWK